MKNSKGWWDIRTKYSLIVSRFLINPRRETEIGHGKKKNYIILACKLRRSEGNRRKDTNWDMSWITGIPITRLVIIRVIVFIESGTRVGRSVDTCLLETEDGGKTSAANPPRTIDLNIPRGDVTLIQQKRVKRHEKWPCF